MKSKNLNFRLGTCFFLLTGVAIGATPSGPIDPVSYSAPIRVACVGDSITLGIGSDSGKDYPSQLQAMLGNGWQVQNFGVSGRTLMKKGDFPYWKEAAFTAAHDFKPDVVIIMLGTNDTKPQNWVYHDQFYADYKEMVESFKNLPEKPRIFICRPCPVQDPGCYGISGVNLAMEIPLIDELASEERIDLIDMNAPLSRKPELLPDHVHPNTAGAAIMSKTAAAALTGKEYP